MPASAHWILIPVFVEIAGCGHIRRIQQEQEEEQHDEEGTGTGVGL